MSKPLNLHATGGVIAQAPGVGILAASGTTVPTDGARGYATGCLFIQTDGGAGTALYVNEGSKTSADFNTAKPAAQSAYTQTYSTADKTVANLTSAALTDNTAGTANTTLEALADGTTYATDVAAIRNNFADLAASCNALRADLIDVKQAVNAIIDDLQALGLVG